MPHARVDGGVSSAGNARSAVGEVPATRGLSAVFCKVVVGLEVSRVSGACWGKAPIFCRFTRRMDAAFALRLLVSLLLASCSTCALLGGCPRRAGALAHRGGVQLTLVELESELDSELEPSETQLDSLPPLGGVPQDLAADQIVPDEWDPASTPADGPGSFVQIFRSSTPYINMHQGSTMVFHLDTRVLDEERLLADLMDDVALITVLGVMPVLVISIRDQVDARLREMGVEPTFHGVYVDTDPRFHAVRRPSTVDRAPTPRASAPQNTGAPERMLRCTCSTPCLGASAPRPRRPSQVRFASRTPR